LYFGLFPDPLLLLDSLGKEPNTCDPLDLLGRIVPRRSRLSVGRGVNARYLLYLGDRQLVLWLWGPERLEPGLWGGGRIDLEPLFLLVLLCRFVLVVCNLSLSVIRRVATEHEINTTLGRADHGRRRGQGLVHFLAESRHPGISLERHRRKCSLSILFNLSARRGGEWVVIWSCPP
jgi:hypothetical protein